MKKIATYIFSALDTHSQGASGRKLSAFVIVICVIAAHVKWITMGNFEQLEMVLTIDYSFIAALLGMTTYETVTKLKNKDEKPSDKPADGADAP